jgi:GMP synthase (glutamine-hydrolysing)
VLAIQGERLHERATELINRIGEVNRVVAQVASRSDTGSMRVAPASLTAERLARLRHADAIVREICAQTGFEHQVWQFPVILIPFGTEDAPDSVVLRPVASTDGMTAASVPIPCDVLTAMQRRLLDEVPGVAAVFHDLTHKPPGTIEWE